MKRRRSKARPFRCRNIAERWFWSLTLPARAALPPQYEGLEELYKTYKDEELVILGFPCNQFANQESGDAESIKQTCYLNYGVTFPMFAKVDVNGANAHPLFDYLTRALHGFGGRSIKWNFTKFLIDAEGKPIRRFGPFVKPSKLDRHIRTAVGK